MLLFDLMPTKSAKQFATDASALPLQVRVKLA